MGRVIKENADSLLNHCAMEIARATADVVGYDVIITDVNGMIVGASCANRIGTFHEASLPVLETGRSTFTTEEEALTLEGTLPGTTYPIQSLGGKTVGTMAITGDPDKVRPFALIVKKQIEILLRERELYAHSVDRESTLQNFVQDLMAFVPGVSNEAMLLSRASDFGYDRTWHYVPLTIDLYQFGRFAASIYREFRSEGREEAEQEVQRVKKTVLLEIRKLFGESRDIASSSQNSRYLILHALCQGTKSYNLEIMEDVRDRADQLLKRTEDIGLKAAIGIGSPALGIAAMAESCQEAWRALGLGKKFKRGPGVYDIADYRLEEMITTIDRRVRNRFVTNVTETLRAQPDAEELKRTIRVWCESSFSLVEAARRLSAHRNTLIYRLDKLKRICQIDLKDFRCCIDLYLALMLDQFAGPAEKEQVLQSVENKGNDS